MRRFLIPSSAVGVWLLMASSSLAGEVHQYAECSKQPSESEIQGAKGAFQAGNVSFTEADYERAILYWEDAFRRDCTATLLLHHLARAYEGQGNLPQAVVALRTYLERTPDVVDRPQIQRRIEVFEQKIEEERQRQARADEEKRARAALPPPTTNTQATSSSSSGMNLYVNPIIPLAVAGVGLAATIVGSIIYFPAQSDVSDYEVRCQFQGVKNNCQYPSDQRAAESAASRRDWGAGITITGLLLAGGGVGWYFFNETKKPAASPAAPAPKAHAFQPWVGPQTAGLSWSSAF